MSLRRHLTSMSALKYAIAPAVAGTAAPPIPKAKAWGAAYTASSPTLPLLDLSQGVPGDPPAASVLYALARTAASPEGAKYGPILGEPALRDALAGEIRYQYHLGDGELTSEDVGITTGCNMAFLVLLMALCPPGTSSVLLPLPSYFNHAMSLSLQGVRPIYIPCDVDAGFIPSLDAARTSLSAAADNRDGVKPRAIVLTTPNNPTGAVYTPQALRAWYDLAQEYNVALVLDETYRDFVEGVPHGLFSVEGWRETLITVGSFSKGYRIPGHRLGSIIASPALLTHVATILDCMQICPPRPPQLALAPLLPSLRPDLAEAALGLRRRLRLFGDVVGRVPGWRVLSSGGFYAYTEYPAAYTNPNPTAEARAALGLEQGEVVRSEHVGRALALHAGVLTLVGGFFMPPLQDPVWETIPGAETIRADRWIRFAVANVPDETVAALGERLGMLNDLLGVE